METPTNTELEELSVQKGRIYGAGLRKALTKYTMWTDYGTRVSATGYMNINTAEAEKRSAHFTPKRTPPRYLSY